MRDIQAENIAAVDAAEEASSWAPRISPQARIYALRQLMIRAGVEPSLFSQWPIELHSASTLVWIGESKSIQFPNASPQLSRELATGQFRVTRAQWLFPLSGRLATLCSDLVVPFAEQEIFGPLFRVVDQHRAECQVDLLTSAWLTLSRFEETCPGKRDLHGRFTAKQSLAWKYGFLQRPVVDEWGLALEQVLRALLPGWQPRDRELRVKLSHDVDVIGVPLNPRTTLGHLLTRRNPRAAFRDALSTFTSARPAQLQCVLDVASIAAQHGINSAVYWKGSPQGPLDSGYPLSNDKVVSTIAKLKDNGVELGVHPGYDTYLAPERLSDEVENVRRALQQRELGGRQHYLRWSPATWKHWEECGLSYDSSVGFADRIGFRAGTCYPYRPWILNLEREADLLEIPLLVMDATLTNYMKLDSSDAMAACRDCIERCRTVGGVFAFLWHNDSLLNFESRLLYEDLLRYLSGAKTYDWKTDIQCFAQHNAA